MSMTVGSMGSGSCLFADVGMMLIEGRVGDTGSNHGFKEGPHCPQLSNSPCHHVCQDSSFMCERASKLRRHMSLLSENCAPMCIDVLLCPECSCGQSRANSTNICQVASSADLLIEQWTVSIITNRNSGGSSSVGEVNERVLLQALRSQLHFSQLSAWYSLGKVRHVCYRLSHPVGCSGFSRPPVEHHFPIAAITPTTYLKVSLKSLPRTEIMPTVNCPLHSGSSALSATVTVFKSVFAELGQCLLDPPARIPAVRNGLVPPVVILLLSLVVAGAVVTGCLVVVCERFRLDEVKKRFFTSSLILKKMEKKHRNINKKGFMMWRDSSKTSSPTRRRRPSPPKARSSLSSRLSMNDVVDDRMLSGCKYIGKHHCEDELELPSNTKGSHAHRHRYHPPSPSSVTQSAHPDINEKDASSSSNKHNIQDLNKPQNHAVLKDRCDIYMRHPSITDGEDSDENIEGTNKNEIPLSTILRNGKGSSTVNPLKRKWATGSGTSHEASSKKLLSEFSGSINKNYNQQSCCMHNDLAETFNKLDISGKNNETSKEQFSTKRKECEDVEIVNGRKGLIIPPPVAHHRPYWTTDSSSEETEGESPVGGVNGGAIHLLNRRGLVSPFRPKPNKPKFHRPLLGNFEENLLSGRLQPTSVVDGFTADLGASGSFCPHHLELPVTVSFFSIEPHSTPYLGEISLGKKGYTVPCSGTIQLTLLNPLGTVIKVFVVPYDVTDMPCNSHTFIRQRTVSDPQRPSHYLIHLRLRRSKSGRVSLVSEIKVMVSRQYDIDSSIRLDLDTATNSSTALKVISVMPSHPKYTVIK